MGVCRGRRPAGWIEFLMHKVLIADHLDPKVVEVFEARGVEARYHPELATDAAAFAEAIGACEGLAVRSAARVTAELLQHADRLQVIGRAGVGIDTVDVEAATARGIVVMNTPFGNTITTAEHSIAMLLALARHIPQANAALRAGEWARSRYVGSEVAGKILGVIGCGNIGAAVVERAVGLGMRVIVYDPYLPAARAESFGATRLDDLEQLLARADFVTLHLPRAKETRNLLSRERIAGMKPGAMLVNCARGGLVDEKALLVALESGHLAGAALDVFESEPAVDNPLPSLPNVVATPHLGASTVEAQEKVARQIAEQICDFLLEGTVANAINMPSVSATEAPLIRPWIAVVETLGTFAGQVTETSIQEIGIEYVGAVAERDIKPLTSALIAALLRPHLGGGVNMVSAPALARSRGVRVTESVSRDPRGAFGSYVLLTVKTERQTRTVAATLFSDGKPRIIQIKGVEMEALPQPHMIYATNIDQPGFIGALGTALGEAGVNIATFALGRAAVGGEAVTLLGVDAEPEEEVLERLRALPLVRQVKAVNFP